MDVATLSAVAASALVTAAVTDSWEGVRLKVAQLFGRGRPDPQIERRLDATREQLAVADPTERKREQAALAIQWTTRFRDLLTDHPDARAELHALLAEIDAVVPVTATDHAVAAGRDVNIQANTIGIAAGVIHGNVAPGSAMPGLADPMT